MEVFWYEIGVGYFDVEFGFGVGDEMYDVDWVDEIVGEEIFV